MPGDSSLAQELLLLFTASAGPCFPHMVSLSTLYADQTCWGCSPGLLEGGRDPGVSNDRKLESRSEPGIKPRYASLGRDILTAGPHVTLFPPYQSCFCSRCRGRQWTSSHMYRLIEKPLASLLQCSYFCSLYSKGLGPHSESAASSEGPRGSSQSLDLAPNSLFLNLRDNIAFQWFTPPTSPTASTSMGLSQELGELGAGSRSLISQYGRDPATWFI